MHVAVGFMPAFKHNQRSLLAVFERGHKSPRLRAFEKILAHLDSSVAGLLTTLQQSYAGELSQSAKRCLRGIEAETKVFLGVALVFVGGLMVVRV